jgi:uncharacterized membrane protein
MAFNTDLFFGILIGLIAYICLYVGKGIQKHAIEGFKVDRTVKSKHSGIWIFGTVLTALFMFVQWVPLAVFHTPMNLIAPLEGIGLITLLIFSFLVLKEKITITEAIGVVLIITGTVLINVVAKEPVELQHSDFNLIRFLIAFGILLAPSIVLTILGFKNSSNIIGVLLGLTAGCFMAFQTLAKRVTDIGELALIFTFVTFALAIFTLTLTQFAFTMSKANVVVPSFASTSIVLTVILGTIVIGESVLPIQIGGVICIVVGIIIMSLFQNKKQEKIQSRDVGISS